VIFGGQIERLTQMVILEIAKKKDQFIKEPLELLDAEPFR